MSSLILNTQQITGIAIKIALIREGKDVQPKILADLIKYILSPLPYLSLIEDKKTS